MSSEAERQANLLRGRPEEEDAIRFAEAVSEDYLRRTSMDKIIELGFSGDQAWNLENFLEFYGLTLEVSDQPLPTDVKKKMVEDGFSPEEADDFLEKLANAKMSLIDTEGEYSLIAANSIIGGEMDRQGKMWGETNERADVSKGQLMKAAMAQLDALHAREYHGSTDVFDQPPCIFPEDWSGFRDYGSTIASLGVSIAYLTNEMRRRIRKGESSFRKSRDPVEQPYTKDQPKELLP
jgi:hypothetical protein